MVNILHSSLGLVVLLALAWAMSENRRAISWKVIWIGVGMQFALAIPLLFFPPIHQLFMLLNDGVVAVQNATRAGTSFVFGYLGGGPSPFQEISVGHNFIFAFQALPLILVFSALSSLLFYWGILPRIVRAISWLLEKSMGLGGALGLSVALNVFVGMVESPLFVRPYLERMSRAELFALMVGGMSTVAGTVMALYATILSTVIPDAMGHILTASIMSAPAAVTVAFLMIPQTTPPMAGQLMPPTAATSAIDAVTAGTRDGVQLLIQIVAMLVVYVAMVALVNSLLSLLPEVSGSSVTLQRLLGWLASPVAWLLGISWQEAQVAGSLIGTKTILNELIAYVDMSHLSQEALSPRSRLIMTYALCGFANLGSLGIMIGGLGEMVPHRRQEIVGLGVRSIVAGVIATCTTGAVVGILHPG